MRRTSEICVVNAGADRPFPTKIDVVAYSREGKILVRSRSALSHDYARKDNLPVND